MARHVEEDLAAVYRAVVQVTYGNGNTWTRRYGAYNSKGVATAQAKKVATGWRGQAEWWVEKADTKWERVS